MVRAFGFDLRPLLVRAGEINHAAAEVRAAQERRRRAREAVTLLKRDALKLVQYGRESAAQGPWERFEAALLTVHKQMRRNLSIEAMAELKEQLEILLDKIRNTLIETKEMSGSDNKNERQYHNSNKDSYESELCQEKAKGEVLQDAELTAPVERAEPNIPLALVLKACPDIEPYAQYPVRHWHELVALAAFVRGMMGISEDAWQQAQRVMGPEVAAVTVAGILQRVSDIKSPGGYLRALTRKAEAGAFSPGPMIMALLRPEVQAA